MTTIEQTNGLGVSIEQGLPLPEIGAGAVFLGVVALVVMWNMGGKKGGDLDGLRARRRRRRRNRR